MNWPFWIELIDASSLKLKSNIYIFIYTIHISHRFALQWWKKFCFSWTSWVNGNPSQRRNSNNCQQSEFSSSTHCCQHGFVSQLIRCRLFSLLWHFFVSNTDEHMEGNIRPLTLFGSTIKVFPDPKKHGRVGKRGGVRDRATAGRPWQSGEYRYKRFV